MGTRLIGEGIEVAWDEDVGTLYMAVIMNWLGIVIALYAQATYV